MEQNLLLKEARTIIREAISANITQRSIDCRGCDNICYDMERIVNRAEKLIGKQRAVECIEVASYVVSRGVYLASNADSSSGFLTNLLWYALDICKKAAESIAPEDASSCDAAIKILIKYAKGKDFDGWEDERYNLVETGIAIVNKKNSPKVYAFLDDIKAKIATDTWSKAYYKNRDTVFRYRLLRQLEGRKAATKMLYDNITISELRVIAIKDLIEEKDYEKAEKLCLEVAETNDHNYYYRDADPSEWNNILKEIYYASKEEDKLISLLERLFVWKSKLAWEELKEIYIKKDEWEEKKWTLLERVRKSTYFYLEILQAEKLWENLMDEIERTDYCIYEYADDLAKIFAERTFTAYIKDVEKECANATTRSKYRKVSRRIKHLKELGGQEQAGIVVARLRESYSHRPALLEELSII